MRVEGVPSYGFRKRKQGLRAPARSHFGKVANWRTYFGPNGTEVTDELTQKLRKFIDLGTLARAAFVVQSNRQATQTWESGAATLGGDPSRPFAAPIFSWRHAMSRMRAKRLIPLEETGRCRGVCTTVMQPACKGFHLTNCSARCSRRP